MQPIKALILNKDYGAITQLLSDNRRLANEGITFDDKNTSKAHPLHRLCDAVFLKQVTDEDAIEIAKILLQFGAIIDGDKATKNADTPLMAAASLHAEKLGIFYIENGADIHYADKNDGATALHWAAYCGRDKLVQKLIAEKADVHQRDTSFNSTPLGWAIQPLMTNDKNNSHRQVDCIKLLLRSGASIDELNTESYKYLQNLAEGDLELNELIP